MSEPEYIYKALEKRIDQPESEWRPSKRRFYSMKHHAKYGVPVDAEWIPSKQMWLDQYGRCYKIHRSIVNWESFDY